jgi:hypothetical protein
MSLLAHASPWNSSEETTNIKKRTPTLNSSIRKTVKNRPYENANTYSEREETPISMGSGNSNPAMSIDDLNSYNSEKQTRVHQMLDQITKVNSENDGSKLADFIPIAPSISTNSNNPVNLLPKSDISVGRVNQSSPEMRRSGGVYLSNEQGLGKYTNYRMAHDPSLQRSASLPETSAYYSNGYGRQTRSAVSTDDQRIMDKINYMIHLLEEQQMEKTNNVMEEFVLYSLLGVFVIYVVDSFSRAGKYMR